MVPALWIEGNRSANNCIGRLETDINEAPEFDFRIYAILDQGNLALTFGRYSVQEGGATIDRGVFCISEVVDQKLVSWEAFENIGEAFRKFRQRLSVDSSD